MNPLGKDRLLFAGTGLLLLLGLVVDLALNQPAVKEIRRLEAYQGQLMGQMAQLGDQHHSNRDLAKALKISTLADLSSEGMNEDPVAYIGRLLERSGLERLELTARGVAETDVLRLHRFTLRTLGGYSAVQGFVRDLELGERLATVDAFSIEGTDRRERLEGRFNLTLYSMISKGTP